MRRQLVERLQTAPVTPNPPSSLNTPSSPNTPTQAPSVDHPYLNNIANRLACDFYGEKELTAYELKGGDGPIMQCRHCIRYALGFCVKHGGQHPSWQEPLSLVLGDGRRFPLEFDCKNCQMNVYTSE